MMFDHSEVEKELREEVEEAWKEEKERSFSWVDDYDINIWKFRCMHPADMRALEDEIDLSDWAPIAEGLGLNNAQIERCKRSQNYTRSVFAVMEESPRFQDLTVKEFLQILVSHNRRDILTKMEKFGRLKTCGAAKTVTLSVQQQAEVLVTASSQGTVNTKPSTFQIHAMVLLIHARDAREDALQLASQLRAPVNGKRLGVLLLQDTDNSRVRSSLMSDPWNNIHKWFMKIDAVVPVLSPQFLRQIQNRDMISEECEWEMRYNRYVYRMMLDQYVACQSKNYFCRAVCPARFMQQVSRNRLLELSGLFNMRWNCSSEEQVTEYSKILYSGVKEWRRIRKRIRESRDGMVM